MHNQKQLGNDIFFTNPAASIEVNVKKYCSVAAKITIFKANKGKKTNSSVFKRRVTSVSNPEYRLPGYPGT